MPRATSKIVSVARALPTAPSAEIADPIFDRIRETIMAGQLPPGTKLGEDQIGAAFGVSRTRVRQSLQLLSAAGLVSLFPHRGAFVAAPSRAEAAETYAARRLIETDIAAAVARRRDPADVRALRDHLKAQRAADAAGDRVRFVSLTGGFHLLLAALAGNRVLEQFVAQLVARTSLMISLYERPAPAACAVDEHEALIEHIMAGDARGCARMMDKHLHAVEGRLRVEESRTAPLNLARLLAGGGPRRRRVRVG